MAKQVEKVVAYVIRNQGSFREILVFEHLDHPDAGIQVPAGTVQENEAVEAALLREVKEEAGLEFTKPNKYLGKFEYFRKDRNELHLRNVFIIEPQEKLANEWIHIVESSDEDKSLRFKFYWLEFENAAKVLAVDQGKYLSLVT